MNTLSWISEMNVLYEDQNNHPLIVPVTLPMVFPSTVCPPHPNRDLLYLLRPRKYFQIFLYPTSSNFLISKADLTQILNSTGNSMLFRFLSTTRETVSDGWIWLLARMLIWTMNARKHAKCRTIQGFFLIQLRLTWQTICNISYLNSKKQIITKIMSLL